MFHHLVAILKTTGKICDTFALMYVCIRHALLRIMYLSSFMAYEHLFLWSQLYSIICTTFVKICQKAKLFPSNQSKPFPFLEIMQLFSTDKDRNCVKLKVIRGHLGRNFTPPGRKDISLLYPTDNTIYISVPRVLQLLTTPIDDAAPLPSVAIWQKVGQKIVEVALFTYLPIIMGKIWSLEWNCDVRSM